MSHQLEVACHNDRPVAVSRGREDIARFVDELLTLGWEHAAATVYAVDPDDRPEFPDHEMAIGTGHDFPADAEVPLDTVREAMWELLTTGGRRPGCVTWQEDRGWTATPGTARHAHRARTRPTPDPG